MFSCPGLSMHLSVDGAHQSQRVRIIVGYHAGCALGIARPPASPDSAAVDTVRYRRRFMRPPP